MICILYFLAATQNANSVKHVIRVSSDVTSIGGIKIEKEDINVTQLIDWLEHRLVKVRSTSVKNIESEEKGRDEAM